MNSQKYFIKKKHFLFLNQILRNSYLFDYLNKYVVEKSSNSFEIDFSKEQVEDVLGLLTWYFTSKGLDSNNEPNANGLLVEELVDIFSPGIYPP